MSRRLEEVARKLKRHAVRAEAERRLANRRWNKAVDAEIEKVTWVAIVEHGHPQYAHFLERASQDQSGADVDKTLIVLRHFPEPMPPPEPKPTQPAPAETQ